MYIQQFDPRKILALLLAITILLSAKAFAQQDVIANKMNTRTEITRPFDPGTTIGAYTTERIDLDVPRMNSYPEIKWYVGPVKIYPTIINGYLVNAISDLPVERITVTNAEGRQVFVQSVGGRDNYLSVPLPNSLNKGIYLITFTGNGWQHTRRFIIP